MKERASTIWAVIFAMLGFVALAVSVFGWVTVGFFVQDNTAVHDERRRLDHEDSQALINAIHELARAVRQSK